MVRAEGAWSERRGVVRAEGRSPQQSNGGQQQDGSQQTHGDDQPHVPTPAWGRGTRVYSVSTYNTLQMDQS